MPPDDPQYTLRRVWLTKEDEKGFYFGFANECLWPMCHITFTRPRFDAKDWETYRRVNELFAEAVLDEAGSDESSMSFDTLKIAQALGDFEALKQADPPRRAIRFHLEGDSASLIEQMAIQLKNQNTS